MHIKESIDFDAADYATLKFSNWNLILFRQALIIQKTELMD